MRGLAGRYVMLNVGDIFPLLTLRLPGGKALSLPHDWQDSWGYIVFFRGQW